MLTNVRRAVAPKLWYSGNSVELQMTLEQAQSVSHSGPCDADVEEVVKALRPSLIKLDRLDVVKELTQYGAWNEVELMDRAQNLRRLVWVAGNSIVEEVEA